MEPSEKGNGSRRNLEFASGKSEIRWIIFYLFQEIVVSESYSSSGIDYTEFAITNLLK